MLPKHIYRIKAGMSQAYIIENETGLFLIDAGSPNQENKILATMQKLGRSDLKLIIITHGHFDHYGSAAALRKHTSAPIAIHQADFNAMVHGQTPLGSVRSWGLLGKLFLPLGEKIWSPENTPADIIFEDGYQFTPFGLKAFVLHTPGHTFGSSCIILENQYAFVGDLVSSRPWLFVQRYYAEDWSQIAPSLKRLQTLQPTWIFPGHGKPVSHKRLIKLKPPTL